jgi:hypothetical protein
VNSICTNSYYRLTPRGYTCACAAGFECKSCVTGMNVDDFSCDDIDECSAGDHDCHESQICNNLPGTFECLCEENFELSAAGECVPVDPCAQGNHNCPALADCNAISSGDPGDPNFQCSCQPGYEFEPMNSNDSIIVCADVDECAKHQHLCSGNEICHNLEPGYECQQAECAQLDCSHSCENNTCVCPEGMKLDDTEINCQIKDSEVDIMCDGDSMKVPKFEIAFFFSIFYQKSILHCLLLRCSFERHFTRRCQCFNWPIRPAIWKTETSSTSTRSTLW